MSILSDERLRYLDENPEDVECEDVRPMASEILALRALCTEVYQVVGMLSHQAGVFDQPEVESALNNLIAASVGNPLPHKTLLPFDVCAAAEAKARRKKAKGDR